MWNSALFMTRVPATFYLAYWKVIRLTKHWKWSAYLTLKVTITTAADDILIFLNFSKKISHNTSCDLADDSHELSRLVFFETKQTKKKLECRLLRISLGTLKIKYSNKQVRANIENPCCDRQAWVESDHMYWNWQIRVNHVNIEQMQQTT